jgi:hypothetical protein
LLCEGGKELKGTMYNAKEHIAATHKSLAEDMGILKEYKEKLEKRKLKKSRH